jgi:MoxR-like ATPase
MLIFKNIIPFKYSKNALTSYQSSTIFTSFAKPLEDNNLSSDSISVYHKALENIKHCKNNSNMKPISDDKNSSTIKRKLKTIIAKMESGLIERSVEIRILLLAAVSGEHVLFIGPPGTAKSELARRLANICKGTYFERLMSSFSVPEELFGPLSMRALEEDHYVRQIKGYLPDCKIAFIDEIFKANSAILNTLVTILNERLYDNGNHRYRIPLLCLVGASNELLENEELEALYDRFLFRRKVFNYFLTQKPMKIKETNSYK